jgi:hypothetical protein
MEQPEGVIELPDGDVVRWTSTPKTEPRTNAGFPTGDGAFQVQLFTLTVQVERRNGRSPAPLVFDRMGWRRMTEIAG